MINYIYFWKNVFPYFVKRVAVPGYTYSIIYIGEHTVQLIAKVKLQIYPAIVLKIWNAPDGILRGPGETDSWKKQKSKISCQTPFNNHNAFPTTQYTAGPMWPMYKARKIANFRRIKNGQSLALCSTRRLDQSGSFSVTYWANSSPPLKWAPKLLENEKFKNKKLKR